MPFDFGDVILIPFPFTNQAASKQRPAVVISQRTYSISRPDIIVMAITSQIHPTLGFADTVITNWQSANLLKPSVVKPVIATIEQNLIIKHLGRLNVDDQKALRKNISLAIN